MINNNIGFIGLGNVGRKLVNNLINKKSKINLYDKNKSADFSFKNKNIHICKDLEELTKKSNIIITCLPSPKSVDKVISQILPFANNKHLWIEMSTTDKDEMIRLSNLFKKGWSSIRIPSYWRRA